ncbi:MAG: arginine--tRNA ligase [Ignavibacteria bacterium]|jgi:arginyl-tRNA synthetase|nr:arginine--tRNA ligase [Ignavibacteria bacterium]MDH7528080.1 arginine--tRNA ligase [Ignavibacteria bacterium]
MKNYLYLIFKNLEGKLSFINTDNIIFTVPKQKEHGDFATNYPFLLAKELKKSPKEIANQIVENLEDTENALEKIEVAGNGFINFKFKKEFIVKQLNLVLEKSSEYGKSNKYLGKKAQVEFVSANPTGPLTVGHGRNAVFGDTIANLLSAVGYKVEREYYFNNAGRQMRVLADSVRLRYLELLGEKIEFPEDYYQGEYIIDIARKIYEEKKDELKNSDDLSYFKNIAEKEIFTDINKTLNRLGIKFDNYFNENSLYETGKIDEVVNAFKEKGYCYEKDGALWLALTKAGLEQDKVIIKSTGEPTYRLPDIAYHIEKFKRNYDLMVDIFGSDHMATYPDVLAGLRILGYDTSKVKVLIHQFVTIVKDGEIVKMSTRKANFVTLDQLIDEVGADVVRYFFLMRSISSHLNFDIGLAKKQTDENPVFYLQYAHARICGILRLAKEEGKNPGNQFELLREEEEIELIKHILNYPDVVLRSAENFDQLILISYLHELAELFHKFYHEHRVLGQEEELTSARLSLCKATQIVLQNGLAILGVKAPERM